MWTNHQMSLWQSIGSSSETGFHVFWIVFSESDKIEGYRSCCLVRIQLSSQGFFRLSFFLGDSLLKTHLGKKRRKIYFTICQEVVFCLIENTTPGCVLGWPDFWPFEWRLGPQVYFVLSTCFSPQLKFCQVYIHTYSVVTGWHGGADWSIFTTRLWVACNQLKCPTVNESDLQLQMKNVALARNYSWSTS